MNKEWYDTTLDDNWDEQWGEGGEHSDELEFEESSLYEEMETFINSPKMSDSFFNHDYEIQNGLTDSTMREFVKKLRIYYSKSRELESVYEMTGQFRSMLISAWMMGLYDNDRYPINTEEYDDEGEGFGSIIADLFFNTVIRMPSKKDINEVFETLEFVISDTNELKKLKKNILKSIEKITKWKNEIKWFLKKHSGRQNYRKKVDKYSKSVNLPEDLKYELYEYHFGDK
jgi:hypothetical protein